VTGVEIHDRAPAGPLAFDLRDILAALGARPRTLSWTCSGVECVGDGAGELHRIADSGTDVDGATLARLAASISQVMDGDFFGRREPGAPPDIIIKAVDSTLWEVFADADALAAIRRRFADVRPAAYDAG